MKTTEVFVELVLTGLIVLVVACLPFVSPSDVDLGLADGLALIAVAYLAGIIFDRVADTIIWRVEHHHHLRLAARRAERRREAGKKKATSRELLPVNPWRMKILESEQKGAEWMDYLRSRIRLARSMAVYLPALTVSAMLAGAGEAFPLQGKVLTLAVVALIYAYAFCRAQGRDEPFKLPRTNDRGLEKKVADLRLAREPTVRSGVVVGGVAVVLAIVLATDGAHRAVMAVGTLLSGGVLSLLAGWTWWRITKTYVAFLRRLGTALS